MIHHKLYSYPAGCSKTQTTYLVTREDVSYHRIMEVLLDLYPKDRHHLACQGYIKGGNYIMILSVVSDLVTDGSFPIFPFVIVIWCSPRELLCLIYCVQF